MFMALSSPLQSLSMGSWREFPIPYTSLIIQYMPNDLTFPFITSGFFWHIDSLHFDANFTLSGDRNNCKCSSKAQHLTVWLIGLILYLADCWKDPDTPSILRPNGQLGDYHCDSSGDLLTSVFAFMKSKMGDNIDFILWTG